MNAIARTRLQRLEQILAQHDGYNRRILADLHVAGWRFRSVKKATEYLAAQHSVAGLMEQQTKGSE